MKRSILSVIALLLVIGLCRSAPEVHVPVSGPMPVPRKYIALTFDDGPHPIHTDAILDVLEENDARATFFIVGSSITENLSSLNRIVQSGSMIANHTWDHTDLTLLDPSRIEKQIGSVYGSIKGLCGTSPWLVRPPYGFADESVCQSCPYPLVCWSIDTLDWAWLDAGRVAEHILTHAEDGDIILMHDLYPSTAEAVAIAVPELRARGFTLVTVPELFKAKGIPLESGHVYYHAK